MVTPLRVDKVPLGFSALSFGEDDVGELLNAWYHFLGPELLSIKCDVSHITVESWGIFADGSTISLQKNAPLSTLSIDSDKHFL